MCAMCVWVGLRLVVLVLLGDRMTSWGILRAAVRTATSLIGHWRCRVEKCKAGANVLPTS
jgi:TRAP-type C4-dicarboxylate transport system permease large subunit